MTAKVRQALQCPRLLTTIVLPLTAFFLPVHRIRAQATSVEPPVDFICPMDKDVHAGSPGKCPRCGMKLTANLPDIAEYRMRVATVPGVLRSRRPALLKFAISHPRSGKPVTRYELIHEKLFHAFLVSQDLDWFAHVHPQPGRPGEFVLPVELPKAGAYRLAADFYPADGTPQLLTQSILTADADKNRLFSVPELIPDLASKKSENLRVELRMEPPQPVAGQETLLFFRLSPDDGIEPYLAAWGHMLVASDDLIDLIHDHPLYVDGVPPPALKKAWPTQIQFNVLFPRERIYRLWVQFQRRGVVNTVSFTVPVKALR